MSSGEARAPGRQLSAVLERLDQVTKSGDGWSARCPAHDDQRASLSVSIGETQPVVFCCHAGCTDAAILEALQMTWADVCEDREPPKRNGKMGTRVHKPLGPIVAAYDYRDENGALLFQTTRHEPKDFRQRRPGGPGEWIDNLDGCPRVLYRLSDLKASQTTVETDVTEGEKDTDTLRSYGRLATTSPMGAKSWAKADWSPIYSRPTVNIFEHNDESGRKFSQGVAAHLTAHGCTVKVIRFTDLPEHGDVTDFLRTNSIDELRARIEAAPIWSAEEELSSSEWKPFPVDVLPAALRDYARAASKVMQIDPTMFVLPALAACAAAIGTTRRIQIKRSWYEGLVFWFAIIAPSGAGKTEPQRKAVAPLHTHQKRAVREYQRAIEKHERDMIKYEADESAWRRAKPNDRGELPEKPKPPWRERYVVEDVTLEGLAPLMLDNPRGLLLAIDELAAWIGQFDAYKKQGGADRARWLRLHREGVLLIDRKTGEPPTLLIDPAAVSIVGGIQPGVFQRTFGREEFDSGLVARLLLAQPRPQVQHWSEEDIPDDVVDHYTALIDSLLRLEHDRGADGEPLPVDVRMSPDARRIWARFFDEHAERTAAATDDDLRAAFSKLQGYAARLTLLIHLIRAASEPEYRHETIPPEAVEAGVALARWFCDETERIYGTLARPDAEPDGEALVEWIKSKGGTVALNDVRRNGPRQYRKAAEQMLQALVSRGIGDWSYARPPGGKGKDIKNFRLRVATNGPEVATTTALAPSETG